MIEATTTEQTATFTDLTGRQILPGSRIAYSGRPGVVTVGTVISMHFGKRYSWDETATVPKIKVRVERTSNKWHDDILTGKRKSNYDWHNNTVVITEIGRTVVLGD